MHPYILIPPTSHHPSTQRPASLHPAGPTVLSLRFGIPALPHLGLIPPSLGTGATLTLVPVPTAPKPVSKMRMATPLLMQALPMGALPQGVRTAPGWWEEQGYPVWMEDSAKGRGREESPAGEGS